jgi:hypothetical protein
MNDGIKASWSEIFSLGYLYNKTINIICLSLKIAHKSGFCSFSVAVRPEIAHMLQFFTVFTLVFPIAGASAHFSPA